MPIRKKGDIDIRTSANGAKVKQTGYTFYSYDKKSAALYFQFRGQDGQPTDLGKATIHLVMILNDDGGKEFIPKSDEIEVISAIRGTAKYVLPEMLLSYSGKVTGYVYMDFDDGSQSDDGQFTFRIKHSMITHVLPKAGDKYVRDFEDVKEQVEQAADKAKSGISDKVAEVESSRSTAIEDIESAMPAVKNTLSDLNKKVDNTRESVENLEIDDRNLLVGTSDEWKQYTFTGWQPSHVAKINAEDEIVKSGDVVTFSLELDNTLDNANVGIRGQMNMFDNKENKYQAFTEFVKSGEISKEKVTATIPDNFKKLEITTVSKEDAKTEKTAAVRCHKLQKGIVATGWNPAPEDYFAEMDKIKQAIINLGGSI